MALRGNILAIRPDVTAPGPVPMPRLPDQRFRGDRWFGNFLRYQVGHRRIGVGPGDWAVHPESRITASKAEQIRC